MTRVIIESDDNWAVNKISNAINAEIMLLQRSIAKTQEKIDWFENKYGKQADRDNLYGSVNDMDLIEWEGELETLKRLRGRLNSLQEIHIERQ